MNLHLLQFANLSIFEQLLLEEKLLRSCDKNYCIINQGSPRNIVMGISGKPEELLHIENVKRQSVPVIKRYSGGGTVIVDHSTLFITFIFNHEPFDFPCFPERIHKWTESLYVNAFGSIPFALRENDYVIEEKKCGGNAQYIKKNRFVHHTSFLWDFEEENMALLLHPKKAPHYRNGRAHCDFLCKLKDHFDCQETFINTFLKVLSEKFDISTIELGSIRCPDAERLSTHLLNIE